MIGLAYALKGEIRSLLRSAEAKPLETVSGVAVYEIEPGILAYTGGVGKVNAAMSAQLSSPVDRQRGLRGEPSGPAHRDGGAGGGFHTARRGHHRHGGPHRARVHGGPGGLPHH